MPVGCYWYSCADNKQKGIDEATFMYNNCLKGKKFEYPIVMDVENEQWQYGKKRAVTNACKGFCETLENLGYYVSIYGSDIGTFKDKVYMNELQCYDKWVARWGSKPTYAIPYGMWQWTDGEKIAGYSVDGDYAYKDYPKLMIEKKVNGYGNEPVSNFFDDTTKGYYSYGDVSKHIANVNKFLYDNGLYGQVLGDYSSAAIKVFQKQNGLDPDGNIGPLTYAKLVEKGFKE
jgi:peptidoglycan hydrolase-like protein with peptidoglycan-binding domain